jgi:uncharacterized membrane protein
VYVQDNKKEHNLLTGFKEVKKSKETTEDDLEHFLFLFILYGVRFFLINLVLWLVKNIVAYMKPEFSVLFSRDPTNMLSPFTHYSYHVHFV